MFSVQLSIEVRRKPAEIGEANYQLSIVNYPVAYPRLKHHQILKLISNYFVRIFVNKKTVTAFNVRIPEV